MASKMIKKALGFFTKSLWRFTTSRNVGKALVLEHFGASMKLFRIHKLGYIKYLYMEPVVYEDFWGPFRKMALKSIKKALGFSLKVEGVLRISEMSKKYWS